MKKNNVLNKKNVCVLMVSMLLASLAMAEDAYTIVVSGSKIEQTLDEAIEQISVIDEDEIKETGAKTLTEALKNLPSVTIKGASPGNPTDSISMQGFSGAYVKILVDGIEVSGDITGSPAVFQLPLENIERIEVIQGASSALYGSDAMGGVINIISKKTETAKASEKIKFSGSVSDEFSASIIGDIRNYAGAQLKLAGKKLFGGASGSFDFSPGAKRQTTDALAGKINYYETPKKMIGFVRGDAGYKDWWGNVNAFGLYNYSDQLSNYSPIGFDKGSTMEYKTQRAETGLTAEFEATDNLSFSAFTSGKFFWLDTEQNVKAGSSSNIKPDHSQSAEWESEIRSSWKLNSYNLFLFGLHENFETMRGESFDGWKRQWQLSAYAQDSITLLDKKISLAPGVRFDFAPPVQESKASFMATPKLSMRFDPTESTVIKLAYGMGYKIPTLKQKYWKFRHSYAPGEGNFILNGNTDLQSEKSQSVSLAVEQNIANILKVGASGFFNYVTDMIATVVTDAVSTPQIRTYVNVNKAMTYGAEIFVSTELDRFYGKIAYSYTGAKQNDNGDWQDMSLRVNHRATLSLAYLIPVIETKVRLDAEWNSPQLITVGSDNYTPDYLMMNIFVGKSFLERKLDVYLRADNVLNNLSFVKGTNGDDQKKYYGLNAGTTFSIGAKFNF